MMFFCHKFFPRELPYIPRQKGWRKSKVCDSFPWMFPPLPPNVFCFSPNLSGLRVEEIKFFPEAIHRFLWPTRGRKQTPG